jgi:hypothetical protein
MNYWILQTSAFIYTSWDKYILIYLNIFLLTYMQGRAQKFCSSSYFTRLMYFAIIFIFLFISLNVSFYMLLFLIYEHGKI